MEKNLTNTPNTNYNGYPKVFDTCPVCGSADRVLESLLEPSLLQPVVMLLKDPQRIKMITTTLPALKIWVDFCLDCGCHYATRLEVLPIPVQMQMQNAQGKIIDPRQK